MPELLLDIPEFISILQLEPSLIRWDGKGRYHPFVGLYIWYEPKQWWHSYSPELAHIYKVKPIEARKILTMLLEEERNKCRS